MGVTNHQRLTENIEVWSTREQAFRPIGPIRATGNEDRNRSFQFIDQQTPAGVARQDLQDSDLEAHDATPRD